MHGKTFFKHLFYHRHVGEMNNENMRINIYFFKDKIEALINLKLTLKIKSMQL